MLDPSLTPTRLVRADERTPVPIVAAERPSRGRTARVCWRLATWWLHGAWLRVFGRATPDENARRLKQVLEDLGGLWIMTGQLLSMRVDLFSAALCRELSSLQMQGTGVPFESVDALVEEELGCPTGEVFAEFDEQPFAATWVCQIHRARLRHEDAWVAVKVQRPFLRESFARDLALMDRLTRVLQWAGILPWMRWTVGLWELRQMVEQETDFRYEAAAIRRMDKILPDSRVVVPQLFDRYSTERLLVTEFIRAALMSDFIRIEGTDPPRLEAWLRENGIDPRTVAKRLFDSFLRQLFEHNFYHGDLYPGNIVLLRDNRIALLHFGSCTFTDREYLQKVRLYVRTLAARDYAKAADLMLMLCTELPDIDVERVKEDVVRALRAWTARTDVPELPYDAKSIDSATVDVMRTLYRYGCALDWGFLRIRRALAILDASLAHLYPEVNYTKLSNRYFRRAERRSFERFTDTLPARVATASMRAVELQERVSEFSMFYGTILRRNAQVFQGTTDRFSYLVGAALASASLALGVVAAIALLVLVARARPDLASWIAGPQLSALLDRLPALDTRIWGAVLIVDAVVVARVRRLRRRFLRGDPGGDRTVVTLP
jgi:ubiquinone biosynthesis protein